MAVSRPKAQNKYTEQNIGNSSYDEDFNVSMVEPMGYDGQALQRPTADNLAVKVVTSGTDTYVCQAAPGSLQASGVWQVFKIDASSGAVITYADGNASFDNVATDPTGLSYS